RINQRHITKPLTQSRAAWRTYSLNDLIRSRQHVRRNRESDLLGGSEIDHQFKFCWLFDWKVSGLCTFQNLVNVSRGAARQVGKAWHIAYKPPIFHKFWPTVDCR